VERYAKQFFTEHAMTGKQGLWWSRISLAGWGRKELENSPKRNAGADVLSRGIGDKSRLQGRAHSTGCCT